MNGSIWKYKEELLIGERNVSVGHRSDVRDMV